MNKQRIGILIAAGLGMLATFMPWLKAPVVGTINGAEWKGDGWITFFLFAENTAMILSLRQSFRTTNNVHQFRRNRRLSCFVHFEGQSSD